MLAGDCALGYPSLSTIPGPPAAAGGTQAAGAAAAAGGNPAAPGPLPPLAARLRAGPPIPGRQPGTG